MERTLILVKPDGVQRGVVGEVISRFEKRGLRLCGLKMLHMSKELAERHYHEHEGKPFYEGLITYITSGPIVAMCWEGSDAIAIARRTMGATRPAEAEPGSIRGDYALEVGRNIVHGSDGPETAAFELDLYFTEDELIDWERSTDQWVFE
ncbi:MAG: nucleoside-diphosphate kinase [Chloroflexi bacterium]|nr:nucleoside-diphosphate kinase [Chloroflexota bacterium]